MTAANETYLIGCQTIDVTPPPGSFLAGYASRHDPADGIDRPLHAVVTAIDDGQAPVLLASIEWLGFYDRTADARSCITAATGIPPERIMLCATHTHCGPLIRRHIDARRHGSLDEEYIARTLEALAEAAAKALEQRRPARLRTGSGWCGFAASRRMPDDAGGVLWKPSLDAPHDHQVSVLTVEAPDGELRQVLFAYACHPTGGGARTRIGPGYPGFACDFLENAYPGVAPAFLQGCGADQKPNAPEPESGGFRQLALEEIQELGSQLGRAVGRVIEADDLRPVCGPVAAAQTFVDLDCEPAAKAEIEAALTSDRPVLREWGEHHAKLQATGRTTPSRVFFEVQSFRFDSSLAIVALAGEMTVEHGLRLKRELGGHFDQVLVAGYANEMVGYVPVRRQIPEGGYEVIDNAKHLLYSGPYVPATEDLIHQAAHRGLELE